MLTQRKDPFRRRAELIAKLLPPQAPVDPVKAAEGLVAESEARQSQRTADRFGSLDELASSHADQIGQTQVAVGLLRDCIDHHGQKIDQAFDEIGQARAESRQAIDAIQQNITLVGDGLTSSLKALGDADKRIAKSIADVRALIKAPVVQEETVELVDVFLDKETLIFSYSDGHKKELLLPAKSGGRNRGMSGPGVVYTAATFKIQTVTADKTLHGIDNMVLCDCTAGPITITLPSALRSRDAQNLIKKIDASENPVIITGDQVDGYPSVSITHQNTGLHLYSTNSNFGWVIS